MKKRVFMLFAMLAVQAHAEPLDYVRFNSALPGAPAHYLPMSASQIADKRMREIMSAKLALTLPIPQMDRDDDLDLQRVLAFADIEIGDHEEETGAGGDATGVPEAIEADDPAEGLTDENVRTLVMLATAMNNPEVMAQVLGGMRPQAPVQGYNPDIRDVVMDASQQGASMLLRGWEVSMRPDGSTRLFQPSSPGSEITLEPGLVIGALGPVVDIRRIGQEVYVTFENGDSISGDVEPMLTGVPPIPPLSNIDENNIEYLLSVPAGMNVTISSSNTPASRN